MGTQDDHMPSEVDKSSVFDSTTGPTVGNDPESEQKIPLLHHLLFFGVVITIIGAYAGLLAYGLFPNSMPTWVSKAPEMLGGAALLLLLLWTLKRVSPRLERPAQVAILLLFALPGLCIYTFYLIGSVLVNVVTSQNLQSIGGRTAISGFLLIMGATLFWIRRRDQLLYGLLEISFGLVANWYTLGSLTRQLEGEVAGPNVAPTFQSVFLRIAVLGGGTYIISRGLTNAFEGFENANRKKQLPSAHGR